MATFGCGRQVVSTETQKADLQPIAAADTRQCLTVPANDSGVALRAGDRSIWWLGSSQVSSVSPDSGLVLRALLNDPSFLETDGTARAVLARLRRTEVVILEPPPGATSDSWWPLASLTSGDSLHVVWRDSSAQSLSYAVHARGNWHQVGSIPHSDSLEFDALRTGAIALDRSGFVLVAKSKYARPNAVVDSPYDWRMLRLHEGVWSVSVVPAWKREPFYITLSHERTGLSLIGLVPSLPGFGWAVRFFPQQTDHVANTTDYRVDESRGQGKVVSIGYPSGTVVLSATVGPADSEGLDQKVLIASRFVAGELQQADSLRVTSDLALYDLASLGTDYPVVFAVSADGNAEMFVGSFSDNGSEKVRLTWVKYALPGIRHMAIPLVKRFGDQVWLYASAASGAAERDAPGVKSRAYQIRCDGLP